MIGSIMQPYFFPYLGYFQLINQSNIFVIYDNIKYTKKGWINRNRIISNEKEKIISLPIKNASDQLSIAERILSDSYDREKLLRQIKSAYQKAPFFNKVNPILEDIIKFQSQNLFEYIENSIRQVCLLLDIKTEILKSSELSIDKNLKGEDKVIEICKSLGFTTYTNPIGGTSLYSKEKFKSQGIDLLFLQCHPRTYPQNSKEFIPNLSIIDLIMNCDKSEISKHLENYSRI